MILNFIEISLYTIIIKYISSCFIHHYFIKSFLHYHLISIKKNHFLCDLITCDDNCGDDFCDDWILQEEPSLQSSHGNSTTENARREDPLNSSVQLKAYPSQRSHGMSIKSH